MSAAVPADVHGVVRTVADYVVAGRPASMVFHWTVPERHAVLQEDVAAINANYVTWERGVLSVFGGYSQSRGEASSLLRTRSWSIDSAAPFVFDVNLASVVGFWRGDVRTMLPASLAPVQRWACPLGLRRKTVKTFAVGYAAVQLGTSDDMELSGSDRAAVASVFSILKTFMGNNGATLVHVSRSKFAGLDPYGGVWPLENTPFCDVYLGTQRRRAQFGPLAGGQVPQ